MKKIIPFLFLLASTAVRAGQQTIGGQWGGLNNGDASFQIPDTEAQDLSNVDITEQAGGIKKRDGYAQFKTLGVSTTGITGSYFFRDVLGTDTLIAVNNGVVYKSVAGAAYSSFITTDTAGAYYDFTDSQGYLWRADSANDQICKWDGTTRTYYPNTPRGDQIEVSPDRLIISGSTSSPNTVYFSASADFTDFTTGILETSAFTESFGLPGQKVTAIKYAMGRLLVWTKTTFSYWYGTNQFDGQIQDISTTLGTTQPNSIIYDQGIIYWQANDNHFYAYDGNRITKLSRNIRGSVANFAGGNSKSLTQTSQSDFDGGTSTQVSPDNSPGDVTLSTFSQTDTTTADFTAGTVSNTFVSNNRVYLSTNNTNVNNNSFENGSVTSPPASNNWTFGTSGPSTYAIPLNSDAKQGSWSVDFGPGVPNTFVSLKLSILDSSGNTLQTFGDDYGSATTSYTQFTKDITSYVGRFIKLKFTGLDSGGLFGTVTSDSFIGSGNNVTYWLKKVGTDIFLDLVEGGRSSITSGTFTSQAFNTTFSSSAWLASGASWTTNSNSITAQTQASSDGSSWDTAVAWSTGSAPTSGAKQYIRYVMTLSTGGTTNGTALPYLDDATINSRAATGTFVSSAINIGSNITSWGNFGADQTLNSGTIGYFIRTATSSAMLASASYTALTRDSQITASTNAYAQVKATFTITAATQIPTLSAFTLNWNEGNIVRSWGTVDKDHRLMWAVGENGSASQNATYIYDIRFNEWLKYSVPFNAPSSVDGSVYFGSTFTGTVFNWPSGTNDAGSAITAFWKSKDFIGSDPFVEKDFNTISFISKSQPASTVDVNYYVNASTTIAGTNSITLTDANSNAFVRNNYLFGSGTFGTFVSFKFGNTTADTPFEVYALEFDYTPRSWRVLP